MSTVEFDIRRHAANGERALCYQAHWLRPDSLNKLREDGMHQPTPWGHSQTEETKAEGITHYTTASHGGYHLSTVRQAELATIFPDFQCFAGQGWYEEDQDWSIVVLAFPMYFSEEQIHAAVETVKGSVQMESNLYSDGGRGYARVAQLIKGRLVEKISEQFKASRAEFWETGSMSTSGKGWSVSLTRVKDGACRTVHFAEYPMQNYYNDADLAVLDVAA